VAILDGQQRATCSAFEQVSAEAVGMQVDFEMARVAAAGAFHFQVP